MIKGFIMDEITNIITGRVEAQECMLGGIK